MRSSIFKSVIRQDIEFFDKSTSGELNSVLSGNILAIKTAIGFKLTDFIILLARGVSCIILSLILAPLFSIVLLGIFPFSILLSVLMIASIKKYKIRELKAYSSAGKIAQESLSSIRTVLSFSLQHSFISKYAENLKTAEDLAIKKGFINGLLSGLSVSLLNAAYAVSIYYGVYLNRKYCDTYTGGIIVQAFFGFVASSNSLAQSLPYLKDLAEAKAAALKVFAIIDKKSKIDVFSNKGKQISNLKGEITFENVFFSYPQRPDTTILNKLSFQIPAGKTIALVGSSGGGKSTIVSLIQRFYLPSNGSIKIDNENIEELDLKWIRSQMALVSQEPVLFTTSIKENIRLGKLDATDEQVIEAAKMANAHSFINACPNKYDTQVGERGVQLSGGQKQRIAIARALIRNPKILLLDEASSALDYESEKIVQDALDKAKIGRTTIIIAHRLSTIRNADIIFSLRDGQLIESGNHDQLMSQQGFYYELSMLQSSVREKVTSEIKENIRYSEVNQIEETNNSTEKNENKSVSETKNNKLIIEKNNKEKSIFNYERKLLKLQLSELSWLILGSISQIVNGLIFPSVSLTFSDIFYLFSLSDYQEQEKASLKYMLILFGFAILNLLSSILLQYSFERCGSKLTKKLRIEVFKSLLRQEVAFHDLDENRSSIFSAKLESSIPFCRGLTSDKIAIMCQGFSGVGFAIIFAMVLNYKLALVLLIFVPIVFFSGVIRGRVNVNSKVNGKAASEEGGRLLIEVVENIKTVVSLGREDYFLKEYIDIFSQGFSQTLRVLFIQAIFYSISNSILFFIQATVFSYGYFLIKNDGLKVTDMYKIYATMTFSSMILGRVYSQIPDQKKGIDAAKAAFKIINRKSKIDSLSEDGLKPKNMIGDIQFNNVHFSYPSRPNIKVLDGFTLFVKNGQTNALVGSSGCGKSTTISLLLRFYDIDSGSITIDGMDIKSLNINWLRSKIGLVSQEPVLFNTTIFENITYGDVERKGIQLDEIINVAVKSNIHNKIENLPQNYETIVGTKGGQLSGGEKQRVAIARALLRTPTILLLDEATSALDTQSEQVVQDALDKARVNRTCIVIAHRLSTIEDSDKISFVKDGSVTEEGTHSSLMKKKKLYYQLQSQNKLN